MTDLEPIYRELTPQQRAAVEALAMGLNHTQAAAKANVAPNTISNWLKNVSFQHHLEELRRETSELITVTKPKIVEMFMEAIQEAKLMSDPSTQIKGLREVGLMLGFYAPEERKITYSSDEKAVRQKLSEMSEKELLELAGKSANVIEGDFRRVDG